VQWSPQGNYIATMHRKGVALWGGPQYARLQRYSHDDVKLIEFSPAERYLMTYSQIRPNSPHEKLQLLLNVFETRSGRKLRIFSGNLDEYACECVGERGGRRELGGPVRERVVG
jgi:translation initiation factor 3 subunit B